MLVPLSKSTINCRCDHTRSQDSTQTVPTFSDHALLLYCLYTAVKMPFFTVRVSFLSMYFFNLFVCKVELLPPFVFETCVTLNSVFSKLTICSQQIAGIRVSVITSFLIKIQFFEIVIPILIRITKNQRAVPKCLYA